MLKGRKSASKCRIEALVQAQRAFKIIMRVIEREFQVLGERLCVAVWPVCVGGKWVKT